MGLTAISGTETLMQLGLLGAANFKAAKSLTAWEQLQQVKVTAKDCQECCCFLWLEAIYLPRWVGKCYIKQCKMLSTQIWIVINQPTN